MIDQETISGFILAGGKSRRMGTDKALMLIQDETLLARMIGLIEPFCEPIAISGQRMAYSSYKIDQIPDVFADCGPISGLFSCLKHTSTDWNLFVSVDVPFVNDELIRFLIAHIGESDCIVPRHDSGIEPLVGLYHRKAIPKLEEMILKGDFKLMNVLSKLNTLYLDCNHLTKKIPKLFHNLNTPDDFKSV